jgi:hypothetical protein
VSLSEVSTATRPRIWTFVGASPTMPTNMTFDPDWKEREQQPKFMTKVVNLRLEPYDVYIGRAGKGQDGYFGNPHPVGWCPICKKNHLREDAIEAFKKDFDARMLTDAKFRSKVEALKGLTLGCFCKPLKCHGDVYQAWLDAL